MVSLVGSTLVRMSVLSRTLLCLCLPPCDHRAQQIVSRCGCRPDHEAMLLEFYSAAWPGVRAPRRGPEWRELGFQGDDPTTDFRATGPEGLRVLLHIAATRPELFRDFVANPRAYGFAVLVLNLTHTVAACLDLVPRGLRAAPHVAPEPYPAACAAFGALFCGSETAFEDVVCACVERCDAVWQSTVVAAAAAAASSTPALLNFQALVHGVLVELQRALVACARHSSMPTTANLHRALVERPSIWRRVCRCREGQSGRVVPVR